MTKNTSPHNIWNEIIKEFNKKRLKYILVGAAALVTHGLPRSTLDIDIYIPAASKTLNKLFKITDTLGLQSEQRTILNLINSPELFSNQWICFSDKGEDILDVFLSKEKDFHELYKNSEIKKDKTLSVRVASLNDLKKMKKESGRAIDLADLKLIQEINKYRNK